LFKKSSEKKTKSALFDQAARGWTKFAVTDRKKIDYREKKKAL
jgi:hypothetical protein